MNNIVAFVGTFVISFIIATGGVYFMNNQFYNIWKFDFRSLNQVIEEQKTAEEAASDSLNASEKTHLPEQTSETQEHKADNSAQKTEYPKTSHTSKTKAEKNEPKEKPGQSAIENIEPESAPDSSYAEWAKQTAKIYESMDAASAAKIIQNYSDSVARDIIYSMNKKKAAGILAILDPKVATRITRAN